MSTYLVWEVENPEDGSHEIEATDEDEAMQKYGTPPDVELSAMLLTSEVACIRVGSFLSEALPATEPARSQEAMERVNEAIRTLTVARTNGQN